MKDRLGKLMEKNGFITLLFALVCVIAGGTLYLSMKNMNKGYNVGNEDFIILGGLDKEIQLEEVEVADMGEIEEMEEDEEELEPSEDEEELEEAIETSLEDQVELEDELEFEDDFEELEERDINLVASKEEGIILPVEGPIITEYTSNVLVYSETLEAWVGHGAIDIGAAEGTAVAAAMDGTVKEVYEDELWGIVIVLEHGNELETRYSNLSTKEMVKEGISVKKGDHISKIGKSAKIEMLMEPHLHFEVIKNGKIIDPRSIIK
ncbi:MAG: M23 family metallopeptidase [Tissierellaceae bacterium]